MLSKKQFAAKNSNLNPVERAAAWREYLATNGVATGSPTGTALAEQQAKSAAGVSASRRLNQLANMRAARFEENVVEIDRILTAAGFVLRNVSECASRYYERDGQHVRVSDHTANEATARWMESVGCVQVTTAAQAEELVA